MHQGTNMNPKRVALSFYCFFAASGFCCLVYQLIWLRIAMAKYGVTTPLISMVIAIFMGGLAFGSWAGGKFSRLKRIDNCRQSMLFYGLAEAIIGLSGLLVAPLLSIGQGILYQNISTDWGSGSYYLASGIIIGILVFPFCIFMGATFPLAMSAFRNFNIKDTPQSFSYLYAANVMGAMCGCIVSAFILIELLGFRHTLLIAALLNFSVALTAILMALNLKSSESPDTIESCHPSAPLTFADWRPLACLFVTGFVSLAMEIVWTRQFVPYLGPVVYTFASLLTAYLAATLAGSLVYRLHFRSRLHWANDNTMRMLLIIAGTASMMPLLAVDFRTPLPVGILPGLARIIFGIGPFCALIGFLTPAVLDRISSGDPQRAGTAYAVNTLGCILGPLAAGFILLPFTSEKWSLFLLSAPLFILGFIPARNNPLAEKQANKSQYLRYVITASLVITLLIIANTRDFEQSFPQRVVRRDHTATVIAAGSGMDKSLLVNGYGMTVLTPVTKIMAHLTLASFATPPKNGLVLCLGMGTSLRSMASWGIHATAVELVPSIPSLLPYYHADGDSLRTSPQIKIVNDDARRFLKHSNEIFDVIVIDPPPPIEAAASSLLYSHEFYAEAAKRLAPGGILQQWIPGWQNGELEPLVLSAMIRSIADQFQYVRIFRSFGDLGLHLLASNQPIRQITPESMTHKLPLTAAVDLVEWGPYHTPQSQFAYLLERELPITEVLRQLPFSQSISDDSPINEYYLLRRLFSAKVKQLQQPLFN